MIKKNKTPNWPPVEDTALNICVQVFVWTYDFITHV